jgi:hypothetical protein
MDARTLMDKVVKELDAKVFIYHQHDEPNFYNTISAPYLDAETKFWLRSMLLPWRRSMDCWLKRIETRRPRAALKWPAPAIIEEQQEAATQRAKLLMLIYNRSRNTAEKNISILPVDMCKLIHKILNTMLTKL